jgi:hypothetical protein
MAAERDRERAKREAMLAVLVRLLDDDDLDYLEGLIRERQKAQRDEWRAGIFRAWVELGCPERSRAQALATDGYSYTARRVLEFAERYVGGDVPDDLCERLELPSGSSYKQAAGVLSKRRYRR